MLPTLKLMGARDRLAGVVLGALLVEIDEAAQSATADPRTPEVAAELRDQLEVAFAVFVGCDRRADVARIGQAVRADHAEVGQLKQLARVLAHVAARRAVGQADLEANAARNDRDLLRLHLHISSPQPEPRHDRRDSSANRP